MQHEIIYNVADMDDANGQKNNFAKTWQKNLCRPDNYCSNRQVMQLYKIDNHSIKPTDKMFNKQISLKSAKNNGLCLKINSTYEHAN